MKVSNVEIELGLAQSPCNIKACAARAVETTHLGNLRSMRVTRGERSCAVLAQYFAIAAIVGVVVGLAIKAPPKDNDPKLYGGERVAN